MIVVTAATGQLGQHTVNELLKRVPPAQVAVAVRNPDKAQDFARRGVAVRQADYDNPAALTTALQGADKVILISGDAPTEQRNIQHQNVIDAARRANVQQMIYTSFIDANADSPFPFGAAHAFTETALRDSGLDWVFARNGLYAEGVLDGADRIIQSGVHVSSAGEGKTSYISRADLARALAAIAATDGHSRQIYDLTGPAAVSQAEIVAILARLSGKPLTYQSISHTALAEGLKQAGLPDFVIPIVIGLNQTIEAGRVDEVSDDVRRLTGQAPDSIEVLLERHLQKG
jgi:NAD(P)H dehydrogenase (quinone)